jgi:hypothetical protein
MEGLILNVIALIWNILLTKILESISKIYHHLVTFNFGTTDDAAYVPKWHLFHLNRLTHVFDTQSQSRTGRPE